MHGDARGRHGQRGAAAQAGRGPEHRTDAGTVAGRWINSAAGREVNANGRLTRSSLRRGHRGQGLTEGTGQMPRSLALFLLAWVLRRFRSLRSGVWARWRSYSRRLSCLASSSAGVGSTRGFGVLGWGVAFFRLVVFCLALGFLVVALRGVVDFLGLTRRLGSSNGKLSTNICLLEGFIPAWAGEPKTAWRCPGFARVYPRVGGRPPNGGLQPVDRQCWGR